MTPTEDDSGAAALLREVKWTEIQVVVGRLLHHCFGLLVDQRWFSGWLVAPLTSSNCGGSPHNRKHAGTLSSENNHPGTCTTLLLFGVIIIIITTMHRIGSASRAEQGFDIKVLFVLLLHITHKLPIFGMERR